MMLFKAIAVAIVAFIGSSSGYEVTSPSSEQGWIASGRQILKWQWGPTDPSNFTVVLTNANISIMGWAEVLDTVVGTTLGQVSLESPFGGWPVGTGFKINMTPDSTNIDNILAQSDYFDIFDPTTTQSRLPTATAPISDSYPPPTGSAPYQDAGSNSPFFNAARPLASGCLGMLSLAVVSHALLLYLF